MSPGIPTFRTVLPLLGLFEAAHPAPPGRTITARNATTTAAIAARRAVRITPPPSGFRIGTLCCFWAEKETPARSAPAGPLPGLGVQQRGGPAPLQGGDEVLGREHAHRQPGVHGGAAQVGDHRGVVE